MNNDELKVSECKPSYEQLEHKNDILVDENIQLKRTIDALLHALVLSDYERNCNLESASHYSELYLEANERANKLYDELEKLQNEK